MWHRDAPRGMNQSWAGNPANSGSACPEQDQTALDAQKIRAWGCSVIGSSRVPAGVTTKADSRSNLGRGPVGLCYLAPIVPGRYVLSFIHPRPFVVPDLGRYSAPT